MTQSFFRYATAAVIALAAPLGGCMETVGRTPYTHGITDTQLGLCHLTDGPATGAKCKAVRPADKGWGWFWWT